MLDNHQYHPMATGFESPSFECLLAAGEKKNTAAMPGSTFQQLKELSRAGDWLFGHLCYDVKNETEQLESKHFDGIGFDAGYFFIPEVVLQLNERQLSIFCETAAASDIFNEINSMPGAVIKTAAVTDLSIKNRISKEDYLATVKKIQLHILRGDCYEINFCQEFFIEDAVINPLAVYEKLARLSPNPFAALYKLNDKFCICASPERYLKKTGSKIISQPIKGTAKRNPEDKYADNNSKQQLQNSAKERSENVMVVDLVRNDLSKICKEATVKVEELFGVYSFPQVHQMISTVSGEVKEGIDWVDMLKATFPMGSMTGAPKKRVMELIEQYEQTKRGLFSGTIGYVHPNGDFDFNVVIRSILYNESNKYLSFQTGGAITFYADPEKEYEESLLKAEAIKMALE
ncbi:MAG: anthranilate synthase component I family protein [Ferruginibacter sp.]